MEQHSKQGKPKSKILKFVSFHGASYSPKHKAHGGRGAFSGPLIPDEARRKPRNNGSSSFGSSDEVDVEPTSPKVSCMGQIKHKKHQQQNEIKKPKRSTGLPPRDHHHHHQALWSPQVEKKTTKKKKNAFGLGRMFSTVNGRRKSDADVDNNIKINNNEAAMAGLPDRAPALSQMRRFASGRGQAFANFDWQAPQAARVAPRHDDDNNPIYHSDEERDNNDHDHDEEREYTGISFSAPLKIGGSPAEVELRPRKEINLWQRRPTMAAPPSPLQVKPPNPPMVRAN